MKKILVIEDDPVNAQVLRDFLAAQGYAMQVARSGPEGLMCFQTNPPDLAIIDVLLPRRNGFEVAFEIRRSPEGREVPLILMSAVFTDREQVEGYAMRGLDVQEYLVKPFALPKLLARVHELVGQA